MCVDAWVAGTLCVCMGLQYYMWGMVARCIDAVGWNVSIAAGGMHLVVGTAPKKSEELHCVGVERLSRE